MSQRSFKLHFKIVQVNENENATYQVCEMQQKQSIVGNLYLWMHILEKKRSKNQWYTL